MAEQCTHPIPALLLPQALGSKECEKQKKSLHNSMKWFVSKDHELPCADWPGLSELVGYRAESAPVKTPGVHTRVLKSV